MKYKKGYKYQLLEEYTVKTELKPIYTFTYLDPFVELKSTGDLVIKVGYAWDGASGPVRDIKKVMRASLVHDALYQLIRTEVIETNKRKEADQIFRDICIEDGLPKWKAKIYYWGLRNFGSVKGEKRIYTFPRAF